MNLAIIPVIITDCVEFSRGLSSWRGISDWGVGDRHATNTSEWTVAAMMIGFLVGLFWGLPYIARIFS